MEMKRFKAYAGDEVTERVICLPSRIVSLKGDEAKEVVTDDPELIWALTNDPAYKEGTTATDKEEDKD